LKGSGEKLTHKQELVIAALLTHATRADVARAAGVSEVTIWRWLKHPGMQTAYLAARRQVVSDAMAQLQAACSEAVQSLQAIIQDAEAPAGARVSAAKAVLELAIRAVETEDLDLRIAALQARQRPS
jgi:hypothetical protein